LRATGDDTPPFPLVHRAAQLGALRLLAHEASATPDMPERMATRPSWGRHATRRDGARLLPASSRTTAGGPLARLLETRACATPFYMLEAWTALEKTLLTTAPRLVAALRTGASEATLASLESAIGHPLPSDLRAFLAVHDGQDSLRDRLPDGELIATHRLLSCEKIQKWWTFWYRPAAAGSSAAPNYTDVPADRCFVEVTESDGDAFLVDLGSGAVYFHVRGDGVYGPLAPSFRGFIEDLSRRLGDGRAQIEDAGTSDAAIWVEDYNPAYLVERFPRLTS
jgi:hypothetical protein